MNSGAKTCPQCGLPNFGLNQVIGYAGPVCGCHWKQIAAVPVGVFDVNKELSDLRKENADLRAELAARSADGVDAVKDAALVQAERVLSDFYANAKVRGAEPAYKHFHEAALACRAALAQAGKEKT